MRPLRSGDTVLEESISTTIKSLSVSHIERKRQSLLPYGIKAIINFFKGCPVAVETLVIVASTITFRKFEGGLANLG